MSPRSRKRRPRWSPGVLVCLAVLFVLQAAGASRRHSLTWDEPSFIGGGYAYLARGDFRFNPGHPPLMQVLEAAPAVLSGVRDPGRSFETYAAAGNPVVLFGRELIFGGSNDPVRLAFFSRLPVAVIGALIVVVAFLWGKQVYTDRGAIVAAVLCAFCPNLIAHGGLATEDVGCTFFMFAAVWCFRRVALDPEASTWRSWILCGAVTGLAFSAKYTALLLIPIYGVLALILWRGTAAWRRGAIAALVIAAVAAVVVTLSYRSADGLLTYARGISTIYADLEGTQESLLMGQWAESRWYYYLVALLLKTALPTLLLVLLGAGTLLMDAARRRDAAVILVPAAVILIVTMFDPVNLGLRRVLPALPFLYLAAGAFADQVLKSGRRAARIAMGIALAWIVTETVVVYPNHLSYFSAIVGGPGEGYKLLDDSNIDWGQDLPALADWQRTHGDGRPVYLAYFGTSVPAAYGVAAVPAPPIETSAPQPSGTYAMSVKMLQTMRRESTQYGPNFDWLSAHKPIGRAGYSIFIYRFP